MENLLFKNAYEFRTNFKWRDFYKGKDISKFSKDEIWESRQHIQMVYQDPGASFNPRMKVVDILTEPLINYDRLKRR